MKRPTAQTIFRTVVFAGAMLGTACSKKPAPAAPVQPATQPEPAATEPAATDEADAPDADKADEEADDQARPRADAKDCNDRSKPGCFSGGLGFVVA